MSYYGRNETIGGNDSNAPDLCIEAILNLPKNMDYSIYDNNGDGAMVLLSTTCEMVAQRLSKSLTRIFRRL